MSLFGEILILTSNLDLNLGWSNVRSVLVQPFRIVAHTNYIQNSALFQSKFDFRPNLPLETQLIDGSYER